MMLALGNDSLVKSGVSPFKYRYDHIMSSPEHKSNGVELMQKALE